MTAKSCWLEVGRRRDQCHDQEEQFAAGTGSCRAKGRIAIQHHGEEVWYRNIRVRGNKQIAIARRGVPIYKCRMNPVRHFVHVPARCRSVGRRTQHPVQGRESGGWLLFDGKNINKHWRNIGQKEVTGAGWVIKDGVLIKEEGKAAGNILTRRTWTDYEFTWDWKVGVKGNNGVKYMVLEKRGAIGHEYQMIDDSFWQKSPLSLTGVFMPCFRAM